ncbi:replication-associated recombination protein A [Blastopirellula marina]|uniref:Replication-associated recombination protein A n=1 Tax=Blastopirellula marina TaxID=124 RepID=A0A2S8F4J9_9BACT|nr:replication-associated recombination protein A [Blastopirellula marina]PQO27081.1 AAA family ATPase [Blastopirellula marina]PTL41228.1 replication-associated recombination protein A [Blastopirellula marina]
MSLFEQAEAKNFDRAKPLAARMRPRNLNEFFGQTHFLAEGKLLWRLIKSNRLTSVLFYGPPGCGKTTLAQLLASETKSRYRQLNAVTSGVKELREVLQEAQSEVATGGRKTLLFIDEIHRFNKSQQDALLPDVENGIVILVGATTSNPFFAVNSALVSRSQVFQFEPLSAAEIREVLDAALKDPHRGLGKFDVVLHDEAADFLAEVCDGDARRALNALEIGVLSSDEKPIQFTRELAEETIQRKAVQYDRDGDTHYDTASALIKSIRGSDVDASIYWLAKMLEGGEDIRFITRRLIISASEDIGNADPHALTIAVSAMQACEMIGLPECQLTLSQTVAYLACAPKSNAATLAIGEARADIREGRVQPVPTHLRDAHYGGAKELGHGEGYQYAHNAPDGIAAQSYLGIDREYYRPVPRGFEATLQKRVEVYRKRLRGEEE